MATAFVLGGAALGCPALGNDDTPGGPFDCQGTDCADGGGNSDANTADGPTLEDAAAGTDSSSDGGEAGFDLVSVAGLALWLRADRGIAIDGTSNMTKWDDQSPQGNHLIANAKLTVTPMAIGPRPGVRFTQSPPMRIGGAASLQPGGSDYLIAFVAKLTGGGVLYSYEMGLPLPPGKDYFTRLGVYGTTGIVYGQFFGGPPPSTEIGGTADLLAGSPPHLFVMRRLAGGPTLEIRVDGAIAATATDASLANSLAGGNPFDLELGAVSGDIAEVVVVIGSAVTARFGEIEGYLRSRYGI